MLKAQHPAQMIKEGGRKKSGEAAVTVMPYYQDGREISPF